MSQVGRLLLVDDDPECASEATAALDPLVEAIRVEHQAEAALDALTPTVDCVVCAASIAEPDLMGFLEAVRSRRQRVPVIVYSGRSLASEALSAGADDYLRRSTVEGEPAVLCHRVRTVLDRPPEPVGGAENTTREDDATGGNANDVAKAADADEDGPEDSTDGAHFERLVQTVADPMYCHDLDGQVTKVNEAMAAFMRADRDELLGRNISEFLSAGAIAEGDRLIDDLVENDDRSGQFEFEIRRESGEPRDVEASISVLTDADGRPHRIAGVLHDVTERTERERELAHYETILETVPVGIFSIDETTEIGWANEEFYERVDMEQSELIGTYFPELIAAGYYPNWVATVYEDHVRTLLTSSNDVEKVQWEVEATTAAGDDVVLDAHTALLPRGPDGEFRGTVNAFRDITELKRYQRQLERQNERLERFASLVSHDLRNPLNVAQGYLEGIEDGLPAETALDEVGRSLDRMEELIEDLLVLARQGQSIDELETVSIAAVAQEAWSTVETMAATVEVATDADCRADRTRLRQLFENLFRNAIEHGGECVAVRVEALDTGFAVVDDGPGVPEGNRDELFEAGVTTAETGTGFGLAIVSEIVDAHGWAVRVTDGADGGARFAVTGVDCPDSAETDDEATTADEQSVGPEVD